MITKGNNMFNKSKVWSVAYTSTVQLVYCDTQQPRSVSDVNSKAGMTSEATTPSNHCSYILTTTYPIAYALALAELYSF